MSRLSESFHPAYHLRPNKAVDRLILMEHLRTLNLRNTLRGYNYIGLGGPFLEDFRLISQQFPRMGLICVEKDTETYKRQRFHQCSRNMTFINSKFGDYIGSQFPTEQAVVVWADYTDLSRECLSQVGDIVRKAVPGSLLRVTVRAESPVPKRFNLDTRMPYPAQVSQKRKPDFERIKKTYSTDMSLAGIVFHPAWFQWGAFSVTNFPQLLTRMIIAVAAGSCTHPKTFLPLHSVMYSDGTIMLSVTGVICRVNERDSLAEHFREHCLFYSADPDKVEEIDVPSLTTKERLHLDEILPTSSANGEACVARLGYLIEGDASAIASKRKLEQYEKYYRLYPYFGKLVP